MVPHYNTNALSFLVGLSKLPNNPESFPVVILAEIIGLQTGDISSVTIIYGPAANWVIPAINAGRGRGHEAES